MRGREGERDDDGRGGLELEQAGCVRVEGTEERSGDVRGGGEEELVKVERLEVRAEIDAPVPVVVGDGLDRGVAAKPGLRDGFDHGPDEALEAAAKGGEDRRRGDARGAGLKAGDQRAVGALHGNELRHDGLDAEGLDVSSKDTREQGSGDAGEDLRAEVAAGEASDALVGFGCDALELGGACEFVVKGLLGGRAEEGRAVDRVEVGGDHHAHAVGHGLEAIRDQDVRLARVVIGREEIGLEAELDSEIAGPGLLGNPAVRSALNGEAFAVNSFNDSAETGRGFEEGRFDVGAGVGELSDLPSGGDAGDASTDDRDAWSHDWCLGRVERRGVRHRGGRMRSGLEGYGGVDLEEIGLVLSRRDLGDGADEGRRVIEAFGAREFEAELAGRLPEGDVDIVEDLDVVAEEADGLHDDASDALSGEGVEGVFDRGTDPGTTANALALKGEEPVGVVHADGGEALGDKLCGALGFDGVRVRGVLFAEFRGARRSTEAEPVDDGAAGDGVRGEEDGDALAGRGAGLGPDGPETLGEGWASSGCSAQPATNSTSMPLRGLEDGAAIEADAGAGVLRSEADGPDSA